MFGHQNDQQYQQPDTAGQPTDPAAQAMPDFNQVPPIAPSAPQYSPPADPAQQDNNWAAPSAPVVDQPQPAVAVAAPDTNSLLDIKQQALGQLSPLVGHLEQTPEEKFKTTMMMIQASDNQSLIQSAYNAAQEIPDEKAKAQALLDVINEINYFTQHHDA